MARLRSPEVTRCLPPIPLEEKTVLHFGCNGGELSRLLRERGASKVYGVDLNAELLDRARHSNPLWLVSRVPSQRLFPHREITAEDLERTALYGRRLDRRVDFAFLAWLAAEPNRPTGMQWVSTPRQAPFRQFLSEVASPLRDDGVVGIGAAGLGTRDPRDLRLFDVTYA